MASGKAEGLMGESLKGANKHTSIRLVVAQGGYSQDYVGWASIFAHAEQR